MANSSSRFFNYDAERRLLYTVMAYSENKKLLDSVEAEDFYDETNQRIVTAAKAIQATGKVPDMVTLLNYPNGKDLVLRLMEYRHTEAFEDRYDVEQYIPLLRDLRLRRDAYRSLQDICGELCNSDTTTDELVAKASQSVAALEGHQRTQTDTSLQGVLQRTYDTIAARATGKLTTVSTGIPELDEITGGLFPGEMTVIGARPGTGKTALTLQIAETAALNGQRVVFVSREMSDVQIGERILARYGVDMARSRVGRLRESDWAAAQKAMRNEAFRNILIDNRSTTVTKVRTNCRRWIAKGGLDLVCVDYLQLVHPEGNVGSRNDQVASISWAFKELAVELNVPVLLLSQLNREAKGRTDPTPLLTDLRDSGSIEQDADNVWMLYCPKRVDDPDIQALIDANEGSERAVVGISIAKARQSTVGMVYTQFLKSQMRFIDTRPVKLTEEDVGGKQE